MGSHNEDIQLTVGVDWVEPHGEEVFEWNGRGSVLTMAEHEHVHLHGKCIKNRYGVACAAPTGRPEHERE